MPDLQQPLGALVLPSDPPPLFFASLPLSSPPSSGGWASAITALNSPPPLRPLLTHVFPPLLYGAINISRSFMRSSVIITHSHLWLHLRMSFQDGPRPVISFDHYLNEKTQRIEG